MIRVLGEKREKLVLRSFRYRSQADDPASAPSHPPHQGLRWFRGRSIGRRGKSRADQSRGSHRDSCSSSNRPKKISIKDRSLLQQSPLLRTLIPGGANQSQSSCAPETHLLSRPLIVMKTLAVLSAIACHVTVGPAVISLSSQTRTLSCSHSHSSICFPDSIQLQAMRSVHPNFSLFSFLLLSHHLLIITRRLCVSAVSPCIIRKHAFHPRLPLRPVYKIVAKKNRLVNRLHVNCITLLAATSVVFTFCVIEWQFLLISPDVFIAIL